MSRYYPPETYGELHAAVSHILFSAEEIEQRVQELGQAISADYAGLNPLLVGVLKGSFPFMADLVRMITIPLEVDFIAVSSYSPETRKRGLVRLEKDLGEPIDGRHVLFIEHVIDTGLTLNYLLRNLQARHPASLNVCVLFDKSHRRLINVPIAYKGFDLPDRFAVGYGLDYRERYRNLPFVGILKAEAFQPNNR
ncbi:MAG: hypoxanthine phosphoribosyltransferase [Chloroflexi bacterium]|nr:hypoxanthine phosphoribosyltransferase [Ardenticatenaceae bacterium]MBL1129320.1 hypoxanthine phosphoribosyltransferase [Chloroflexota bacterium]NOG35397.1 hypoxanthine phosphoribosyltransferase [Chloroflexota bacterium]GIK58627.1 MAG: hypoxanthine phosphoribosyltransferase [Chloroflexota bacterium]